MKKILVGLFSLLFASMAVADGIGPQGGSGGGGSVTWPTTKDIVISNGTSTPGGLAPVNGDCVLGSAGSWVAGSCSGSSANFNAIGSGTNTTAAMVVGAGSTLNFTSTGTINASALLGSTWASPAAIGTGTPNSGNFTNITYSGEFLYSNATVAAAGTNQATATPTTEDTIVVYTGTGGVALPAAIAGAQKIFINVTGSNINLYTVNGGNDTINALTNTQAYVIPPLYAALVTCDSATLWTAEIANIPSGFYYNTNTATSSTTLTAANITGANIGFVGITLNMSGTLSGAANATLPTVANLVNAIVNPTANQQYTLRIINNSSGLFSWTPVTNTGWTLTNVVAIPAGQFEDFYVTLTSLTTATLQGVNLGMQQTNGTIAGPITGTSTSANCLAVGANGSTNPVLGADCSTASVATGLKAVGAAAGAGVALNVTTSGTNENLTINAAGTGAVSARMMKRVITATNATSITPNTNTADLTYQGNTQALGTLTINADTGNPNNGQSWILKIKSTNVQTFAWNSGYVGGATALPVASTGGGKIDEYAFIYDSVNSVWEFTGSATGF